MTKACISLCTRCRLAHQRGLVLDLPKVEPVVGKLNTICLHVAKRTQEGGGGAGGGAIRRRQCAVEWGRILACQQAASQAAGECSARLQCLWPEGGCRRAAVQLEVLGWKACASLHLPNCCFPRLASPGVPAGLLAEGTPYQQPGRPTGPRRQGCIEPAVPSLKALCALCASRVSLFGCEERLHSHKEPKNAAIWRHGDVALER